MGSLPDGYENVRLVNNVHLEPHCYNCTELSLHLMLS